jgi:hypothetical protein
MYLHMIVTYYVIENWHVWAVWAPEFLETTAKKPPPNLSSRMHAGPNPARFKHV